ncbi:hypothetical protein [Paenibacillus sp. FJAT-26967]|uniref:hypothetical protein n=1 Tax=Paenibacillus sp. FJAT-26967 TaxID=1729690 RepID=UPI00156158C0|nr:hypothetical protein [Paenibacillus sp. FJAT-26967]
MNKGIAVIATEKGKWNVRVVQVKETWGTAGFAWIAEGAAVKRAHAAAEAV